MPSVTEERLERLLKQEEQLKARIQQAKARMRRQDDKIRTGKLIAWGVVIEQMLKDSEESLTPEQWAGTCKRFLNGRTRERALVQELAEFAEIEADRETTV